MKCAFSCIVAYLSNVCPDCVNGECVLSDGGATAFCDCKDGYSGKLCDRKIFLDQYLSLVYLKELKKVIT